MSEVAFAPQKGNINTIIVDKNLSQNTACSNAVNAPKSISLIPIASIIGITAVLAIVLPLAIRFGGSNDKHYIRRSFNSTASNKKNNSITENYIIKSGDEDTLLFHSSYLDSIESMKINDNPTNITNSITFDNQGTNKVEIKFKDNLDSLNDLFLNCHLLNEINLNNLNTEKVTSTADMFNGCNNLQKINFTDFDTKNIKNISNMFADCEKLTSIDVSIFNYDTLIDIQGLFYNCNGLTTINFGNLNTKNVINMSKLFSGCTSLTEIDFDEDNNFVTGNVLDMSYMFHYCNNLQRICLICVKT